MAHRVGTPLRPRSRDRRGSTGAVAQRRATSSMSSTVERRFRLATGSTAPVSTCAARCGGNDRKSAGSQSHTSSPERGSDAGRDRHAGCRGFATLPTRRHRLDRNHGPNYGCLRVCRAVWAFANFKSLRCACSAYASQAAYSLRHTNRSAADIVRIPVDPGGRSGVIRALVPSPGFVL
jgi:hypothetical protein